MARYALIYNNAVSEYRECSTPPIPRYINGKPILRPVVHIPSPEYNPTTERRVESILVLDDRVEIFYQIVPISEVELTTSLEDIKSVRKLLIEQSRDAEILKDVIAFNRPWQADSRSQTLLSSAITMASAGGPLPPVWRDSDNNDLVITDLVQLVTIADAMAAQTQAAYTKSWTLKGQIDAVTDPIAGPALINAITWE